MGPRVFYVLFFINIHTRKVHIAGITKHPKKEWITETTKTLKFLCDESKTDTKKLLIRDRDTKFTEEFDQILKSHGIEIKELPYKSPNLNPYAEAWVSTIKRECLDYFAVFGKEHFEYLVKEYANYYNTLRPHSGLNDRPPESVETKSNKDIHCDSRLGGLTKHYYRG